MGRRGPPGFNCLSSERQARLRQLWQEGASADDIAAEFKIARRTVYLWGAICGVARGAKPPARQRQRLAADTLHLAGISQSEANRMALAAGKSFHVMLLAAVPHFWASLSAEEQDGTKASILDTQKRFAPDWLEHAGEARLRRAENDLGEAEAVFLVGLMVEDLAQGGEAADRVIAALNRAGADPAAQAALRLKAVALAPHLEREAESFGRARRRETAKWAARAERKWSFTVAAT